MIFQSVNRVFLPIKTHYALFYGGTSTVQPVMPIYAKVLGFSTFVVGTIYTILPLFGLIIKPAFGALADKFKWHRGVLIAWEVVVCLVYLGIWFIPPAHPKYPARQLHPNYNMSSICPSPGVPPVFFAEDIKCNSSCSFDHQLCRDLENYDFCSAFQSFPLSYVNSTGLKTLHRTGGNIYSINFDKNCRATCEISCEDSDDSIGDTYSQWQFWLFLVLLIGAWGGTSVITTLSDTLCIEICQDPSLYGRQRLWGSIGWGVLAVINGFLIDAVSTPGEEINYAPAFYLMVGPLVIDAILSYKLKITIPAQSKNIGKDVWSVMIVPRNVIFMIWCGMVGVSFAIYWNFLIWLLEDLAEEQGDGIVGSMKTIEGLVNGMQCFFGETPAFFFAGWLVNKIGHFRSMTLIFVAIGCRYTLYSILVNPWWCLPIELLHFNYGIFYSTMTSYAKEVGPPGTEATIQSVLCAICEGVGAAVGSFVGGLLYDSYGGSNMMLVFGITFFVCAAINEFIILLFHILERGQKKHDNSIENVSQIIRLPEANKPSN